MSVILSKCAECTHLYAEDKKLSCKAFPEGIPFEVFKDADEDKECNNGIKFERD
ncbi:MAG: glutamyl-tRNA amidotransferase [Eubacteriaceae bacterium]|nr:glutamyl-tRNA amidotransferase [Eubacteriaceae bacterium]